MSSQTEAKENKEILQELPKPEAVQVPEPGQSSSIQTKSDPENGASKDKRESSKRDKGDQGKKGRSEGEGNNVDLDGKNKNLEFQLGVAISVYQNSGLPLLMPFVISLYTFNSSFQFILWTIKAETRRAFEESQKSTDQHFQFRLVFV